MKYLRLALYSFGLLTAIGELALFTQIFRVIADYFVEEYIANPSLLISIEPAFVFAGTLLVWVNQIFYCAHKLLELKQESKYNENIDSILVWIVANILYILSHSLFPSDWTARIYLLVALFAIADILMPILIIKHWKQMIRKDLPVIV